MEPDPFVGQTLDARYFIEARVGRGGMGAVYKAQHLLMAQAVAIKVLHTDRANDASMVKRFIREAQSCFQIDHPNCVRVTDFGSLPDGTLYMVMEFLDGRTVDAELAADGVLSSRRVRHVGAQISDALAYAHGLGLIHRDLKPANLMLLQRASDNDFVKVFDFGLAKLFDDGAVLTGLSLSPLTQAGIVFGTPEYMSPEQALGGDLTPKSDVYTLGVCCYEMLTDCLPFEGATFTEILSKHVRETPLRPSQKRPGLAIDPELERVVMSCLDKNAALRPGTAQLAALLRSTGVAATLATSVAEISSSETVLLPPTEMRAQPAPASPAKQTRSDESWLDQALRAQRSNRKFALWLGTGVLMAAGVATVALSAGSDAHEAPSARAEELVSDAGIIVTPQAVVSVDARPAPDASTHDAPPSEPATSRRDKPAAGNAHLAAAEEAFKQKNLLKQLAEGNAALKQVPRSRRAAYLVGDALAKSGDKVRACTFFLRSSRKHYRARGCGD